MPTRGGNPRITIQADATPVDRATRDAEKSLDRLSNAGVRAGASLRTHVGGAGSKMGIALGAGLTPLVGIAAAGGLAAGAALSHSLGQAMNAQAANNKLKAQLGLSSKESARLGKVAGKLYADNYGDSLEQVNGAIRSVLTDVDGMSKASGARLKGFTGDVIELSQAFDQDLGGVTRSVGQLMRTGLAKNAQDALNIVTVGFQAGDDKAGDFLDTLNEYGTQFRKLGIDGKTATGIISQGLKAGARDGDLVADALKEFSIRAVDGSTTTKQGFEALGLSAQKMSEQIGKGGAPAAKGLDQVLDRLRAIKDPVKQSQAAVQLFGTQAEDLGKALYAIDPSKAVRGLNDVDGAARKVNNTMGSGAKSQITAFKRQLDLTLTSIGQKALPTIGKLASTFTGLLKGARDGGSALGHIKDAVDRVKTAVSSWVTRNRADIDSVVKAFTTVAVFAKQVFEDTVVPIVRRSLAAIGPIFDGVWHTIRGVVRLISGLLSGNWSKAWSGAKEAVSGAWKAIKTLAVTGAENLGEIIKDLGPKLVKLIVKGLENLGSALTTGIWEGIKAAAKAVPGLAAGALKGIGHAITSGISKGFGALNPFGDGLGRPSLPSGGLSGGNSLMGARSILAPFASMAGRFGLHTSSGSRPGAVTVSGNRSYHADGYAIDEAGTPAGMLGYFRYLKAKFGSVLRELIYTPGGVGIKDGRPYTYTGAVAADHYDHVHVAFTGGAGDGEGVTGKVSTFGPPLERAGTTASGVSSSEPGIAIYNRATLGKLFRVTVGGRTATLKQTDIGPAPWTGRKIDVTGAAARLLGIDPAKFPTDSTARAVLIAGGGRGTTAKAVTKTYTAIAPGGLGAMTTGTLTASAGGSSYTAGPMGPREAARTYGGGVDAAELQRAQADDNPKKLLTAVSREITLKQTRLNYLLKTLNKRLSKATRSKFAQEATQLIGELRDLRALASNLGASITGGAKHVDPSTGLPTSGDDTGSSSGPVFDASSGESYVGEYGWIQAGMAQAALTPGLDDDRAEAGNLVDYAQHHYDAALATGDAGAIQDAATLLGSAIDGLKQLNDTLTTSNELQQQRDSVNAEIVANQGKILALASQGPAILAAVVAAVNGGIGGTIGLGSMTPGYAGGVASYGSAGRL